MTATTQKKGPAALERLPSRVQSPTGKSKMNAHDVNTAARAAPTRTFANLEHQVSSLASMTAIAADLLDRKMTDVRTLAGQRREPGDNWRIILTDHEMNQLSFAWNDVVARVMKLEKDYFAILEGRAEA